MKTGSGTKGNLLRRHGTYTPPLPGVPLLELLGESRVLIENHKGVAAYAEDKICVLVKYGRLVVCGSGLTLGYMSKCQLAITGCIDAVLVERK